MILSSNELNEFVVEPWMELEPFDPKLIKEIKRHHPYKFLLRILYHYYPSYNDWDENDANPEYDGYEDVTDFYFRMLDDYTRYGIAFERQFYLFPDNKLGVFEYENFEKPGYCLVKNHYDKKTLLFNKVKTIDLDEHDSGEKPLSDEEKQKRDLIKKQTNKKLQVAMMDPYVYNNDKFFEYVTKVTEMQDFLIKNFNLRMTYDGIDYFFLTKFD